MMHKYTSYKNQEKKRKEISPPYLLDLADEENSKRKCIITKDEVKMPKQTNNGH